MTTYAPPAPRSRRSRATITTLLAASVVAAAVTGVVVTNDSAPSGTSSTEAVVSVEASQRAEQIAAVRAELDLLRSIHVTNPAVRSALAEDIALLEAVLAGDVPLQAAQPLVEDAGTRVPTNVR